MCMRRAVAREKRGDDIIEKTPAEFCCAHMTRIDVEPTARLRLRELRLDQLGAETCRGLEIRQRDTAIQAQRIEHELERQLVGCNEVVSADAPGTMRVFEIPAWRAQFPAPADLELGSR